MDRDLDRDEDRGHEVDVQEEAERCSRRDGLQAGAARRARFRSMALEFLDLSPRLWPALERLFGKNGACGGCWCMWWRLEKGERWPEVKGAPARRRLRALVRAGRANGVLAFEGGEPVGWCAYQRRVDLPRLDRAPSLACRDAERVWSLPCFFVKAGWR